jgi:hypothetical protein
MSAKPDDLEAVRAVAEALKAFDPNEQERIIRWAREKLGLPQGGAASSAAAASAAGDTTLAPSAQVVQGQDIRSFIAAKNPQSDNQFSAAVAYYYRFVAKEGDRKDSIKSADLVNATRMVNWSRLSRPAQTLGNAHAAGYLDKAAHGAYAINAVGENLVAMAMPGSNTAAVATRKGKAKKVKAKRQTKRK